MVLMALADLPIRGIAEALSLAVIVAALLTIPYMTAALFWNRRNPKVRATYDGRNAFYHPSLWFLTWLTRINLGVMLFIMSVLFFRIYLRYEALADDVQQPWWSMALSAFSSLVLLAALTLPATFLFTAKHWIMTDEELDRAGKLDGVEGVRYAYGDEGEE